MFLEELFHISSLDPHEITGYMKAIFHQNSSYFSTEHYKLCLFIWNIYMEVQMCKIS